MRASTDFNPGNWDSFLSASRLVNAVGAWPDRCDVFMSAEERNLVLATLSGGVVGVGDALGAVNTNHLFRAGSGRNTVIVKPDVSLAPMDITLSRRCPGPGRPHDCVHLYRYNGFMAFYVYSYTVVLPTPAPASFSASLGVAGNAYVSDYFNAVGTIVTNGNSYNSRRQRGTSGQLVLHCVMQVAGPSGVAFWRRRQIRHPRGKGYPPVRRRCGASHGPVCVLGRLSVTLCGYSPSAPR